MIDITVHMHQSTGNPDSKIANKLDASQKRQNKKKNYIEMIDACKCWNPIRILLLGQDRANAWIHCLQ